MPTHAPDDLGDRVWRALDAMDAAVAVLDEGGRILFANALARAWLSPASDPVGQNIAMLLPDLGSALTKVATEPLRGELHIARENGESMLVRYTVTTVEDAVEANPPSYAVVLEDVTEAQLRRDERDRLLRLATIGGVMPTVLHELRNPVAAIHAAVEDALESGDPASRPIFDALFREIRRLTLSVEGIGSATRVLRAARPMNLVPSLQECCDALEPRATESGIFLECALDPLPPLPFDAAVMRALAFHLLSNALRECPSGSRVTLGASMSDDDTWVEIWVEDDGPGMTEDVRRQCAELFFTTRSGASGIGLTLCLEAAVEAGGEMRVDSAEGKGTRVTLRLPV